MFRRNANRSESQQLAEVALRLQPATFYYTIDRAGQQIGAASSSVDTTANTLVSEEYFVGDYPSAASVERTSARWQSRLTRGFRLADLTIDIARQTRPFSINASVEEDTLLFIAGTLALSGLPPFSGFYSKDSILALAQERHNYILFGVGLFVAVLTTFIAPFLVLVLGGQSYLPHAAVALQIMIWSIPFGWINSIVNYILIALGQQSKLTRAFVVGLSFNIIANLILIPRFSYVAAAFVTILSELVEGLVFMIYLERSLGSIRWIRLLWRLFAAAGAMFILMGLAWAWHPIAGLVVGPMVYVGVLLALKAIGPEERGMLDRLRGTPSAEGNQRIEESAASTI